LQTGSQKVESSSLSSSTSQRQDPTRYLLSVRISTLMFWDIDDVPERRKTIGPGTVFKAVFVDYSI